MPFSEIQPKVQEKSESLFLGKQTLGTRDVHNLWS